MELQTFTQETVDSILKPRNADTHKGDYGRVLLLCGSVGYTGAAAFAAMGALRSGAGLVYLGVPQSIYEIEAIKLWEPIVLPLMDDEGKLCTGATRQISELLPRMDAVLIGPGLGINEGVRSVVCWILENFSGPVVLDADGINALQRHRYVLRDRTSPTIITPHEGEFKRLGGDLSKGRLEAAVELSRALGVTVVLKGHRTIITDGMRHFENTTGNPGMAVGGSGDVLAGMIVSLLGQKIDPLQAAVCAVWLHGAAGDVCAKEIGQYGMLPSDMLTVLPKLLK